MSIQVKNIHKKFGNFAALNDVSLDFPTGELVALLGPSGCGKTTLLRIIAGLEQPDVGVVEFHGEDATHVHVRQRQVGFVFQHYALFRHMTVFDNVAFGLNVRPRDRRPSKDQIAARVHELLNLVQLDWLADRYPDQLSGGQRQRIALARALAVEPKVLLLDEPFGALDAKVRKDLRRWLRRLHDELHITSIFVTHDQEEAMEVADKIVVLNKGQIEQIGTPDEIYNNPASPFVYDFIGQVNLFHSRVDNGWAHIGDYKLPAPEHAEARDRAAIAYVRPHDIELSAQPIEGAIEARVSHVSTAGAVLRIELQHQLSDQVLQVELPRAQERSLNLEIGASVYARPTNSKVFLAG
ncbi:sulfate/molybdate ABC transporter ATP-binding protein [Cellvibrio japonicus]|uniref:Sulfate/thiosulfate import ATP-binding protein cysA 2 n=1 Tax=Cellvibrio japonicus (strain Ueda107) TaxID=498211 RepID=B3PJC8_CELJU|nr:sulfate ABC transporter ATP-binding protein [Cellvibrio japonicus]ACE83804.1 sulfate/thiosulfate import ATP-binding protein cysA 2 [Cellvibrio japonicus Ueda107]QEI12674.1 sulfate ABC transporter ATP-binding protein [Cellvibrio japonicus]QEI16248.1 sulfate ABC transporter ATP-binding protein [Cellvibrio japonicus]QEI19826.1 sulfate ABC transporter ATP-binding protein [Cellvibrio japonicus]